MSMVGEKTDTSFQLKADFFPLTVVKLTLLDPDAIARELDQTIAQAPNYLVNAPVVIDVQMISKALQKEIDFKNICNAFQSRKILPVGIRGLHENYKAAALEYGLAIIKPKPLNLADGNSRVVAPEKPPATTQTEKTNTKAKLATKIITKPVRSGTQVYAKGGDLVILAAVNPGAECIADGNIHVYGPLRGRALAGANGNKDARIFCESLEAELLSVAGQYLIKDQIKPPKTKKPLIQVFLQEDKLQIEGV